MRFETWSLEKRFAVLSLITLVLLGSLILAGNIWYTKKQLLSAATRYSEAWANSVIKHQFRESDFSEGISTERYYKINKFFMENVLNEEIIRVNVWNQEGQVVFSNEKNIVHKRFRIGNALTKALRGQTKANLSIVKQKSDSNHVSRKLEVYVPIYAKDNRKVLGAFELHINGQALADELHHNYWVTSLSTIGSLIILYGALMGVMKKASSTILAQSNEINKLYRNLDDSLEWQEKSQVGTIKALLSTLNAKDNYTAGHSIRVARYALSIGKKIGFSDQQLKVLEVAALFHDIGKIGIPETILNKPGQFSAEENELIKKHPSIGADIVGSIHYFVKHAKIIRHHHERVDGMGYPDRLKDDEIPLESRILAVADTYDALNSDRPYRKGVSKEKALAIIEAVKGSQLDEEVVLSFLEQMR